MPKSRKAPKSGPKSRVNRGPTKKKTVTFKFPLSQLVSSGRNGNSEELVKDMSKLPQFVKDQINFFLERTYFLILAQNYEVGSNKFKIIYGKNTYVTVKLNLDNLDETEFIKAIEFVHNTGIWNRKYKEFSYEDDDEEDEDDEDSYISWSPCWPVVDDVDKKYKLYPPSIDNLSLTKYSRY
jgi:hypothetical protein